MHTPLLCLALLCATAAVAEPPNTLSPTRSRNLETVLLRAVREVGFDQVRDWRHKGERIRHMPNVDVAVIELDAEGRPVAAANVLLSRDYPKGQAVPLDARTLGAEPVRFTKWDLERWDDKKGWGDAPAGDDLVPGREGAPLRFMAPYPASLFKILIAYRVMRLVDRGELTLDTPYRFLRDTEDKGERPLRGWLEPMIVESNNTATEALVKLLHERGAMEGLNAEYEALGLGTLQVNGTSPVTGRNWQPGSLHMTAMDTAKLFLLINGGPGVLWRTREGRAVTAAELSEPTRRYLKKLLADQGYTEGLSSTVVCGDPNARKGIPTAEPARWLAADGTATVGETAFKRDTRPCNAAAEVEFLHKTGRTENYASDAGIVHSLPRKAPRHYVIAFLSNLGDRYYDEGLAWAANFADEENGTPARVTGIRETQSIAALGHRVDEALKQHGPGKR
jgi:beta-lactamase family protein